MKPTRGEILRMFYSGLRSRTTVPHQPTNWKNKCITAKSVQVKPYISRGFGSRFPDVSNFHLYHTQIPVYHYPEFLEENSLQLVFKVIN